MKLPFGLLVLLLCLIVHGPAFSHATIGRSVGHVRNANIGQTASQSLPSAPQQKSRGDTPRCSL